ncbi:MAG TPA: nucleotidyltransferase domain-containing protein [Burkholderiaceae bacterium]
MSNLPLDVEQSLETFVEAAKGAFGDDLKSIVLFGSAASGALRATSDVNLLLVLRRFSQESADRLREPLRLAHATVQLNAMFLLDDELADAIEAFAVKFSDIVSRHRVLFGGNPFAGVSVTRESLKRRTAQVLLNLQLRLRERYIALSLREEQLAHLIADAAPPLRSAAAAILQLEGQTEPTAKQALEHIVHEAGAADLEPALRHMSEARETGKLPPGVALPCLMDLLRLTQLLRERAARIA